MQRIASMSPEILNKARAPLTGQKTIHGGIRMTVREKLEQMARDVEIPVDGISEYDLERAHFALINLIGTSGERYTLQTITDAEHADVDLEIERRLRGN
jgi:hypothetical protein